jgi:hypothetical protein
MKKAVLLVLALILASCTAVQSVRLCGWKSIRPGFDCCCWETAAYQIQCGAVPRGSC